MSDYEKMQYQTSPYQMDRKVCEIVFMNEGRKEASHGNVLWEKEVDASRIVWAWVGQKADIGTFTSEFVGHIN